MALNAAAQGHSGLDVISDGAITEFYNLMEEAMKVSEVMPGRYNIITSPSYANPCPVQESSFTTIDISTGQPNVVSLENSYITAKMKVHAKIDVAQACENGADTNPQTYFVGFKSSLDAVAKYQIFHNGKLFYDQPYCSEESYVLQTVIPDHVKCTRPHQYTSHEAAWNHDSNVCGAYVTFVKTEANKTFDVVIPLKIDITQFLTFGEFRYLPGFFGTWSIRLWFSSQNLVVCPVNPTLVGAVAGSDLSRRFTQIGHAFKGITNYASNALTVSDVNISSSGCEIEYVMLNSAQFALQFPVYDSLKARYYTEPLAIPCCSMSYGRFSGGMKKNNGFSCTYNSAVSCCECLFLLPFVNDQHHTVCRNPKWTQAFLNISGYGNFPQQSVDTYYATDPDSYMRFLTTTLDALNINNSSIMSMTKELSASLSANLYNSCVVGDDDTGVNDMVTNASNNPDDTNFLIGIPFANSDDFQGGLTTNGQAQMKFQVGGSDMTTPDGLDPNISVTAMLLCDRAILIRTLPYSEQPQVKLVEEKLRIVPN